jgi:hypothetical protein
VLSAPRDPRGRVEEEAATFAESISVAEAAFDDLPIFMTVVGIESYERTVDVHAVFNFKFYSSSTCELDEGSPNAFIFRQREEYLWSECVPFASATHSDFLVAIACSMRLSNM